MTNSERTREHDDAFWLDGETLIVREDPGAKPVYDLEERTARFGEAVIDFAKKIPRDPVTERIITQLIGAGTSVGANYTEADDSVSKREFLKCIATCKKEAREQWMEARELHLIFAKIWRSGKQQEQGK
jgi:four helix bundle protein